MKKHNKIRIFLSTCLVALATVFCGVLVSTAPVKANAATLGADVYQTDGASVRVFKKLPDETLEPTDKTGIRFHVEMGAGYSVNGTPLLDEATLNEKNGSFKMAEGYKTYTLVVPTSLLNGSPLTWANADAVTAQKIETTEYWYKDTDGNWESVAYIYNLPVNKRTQVFSYCGVIVDGSGNVVASTNVEQRHIAFVAKSSYDDTIAGNHNWGDNVETAKDVLLTFIPKYSITYNVNGTATTEDVLWGEKPKAVPDFTVSNKGHVEKSAAWYDTTGSETIDLTAAMQYGDDRTLTLTASSSAEFQVTGVTDDNHIAYDGKVYSGVRIYATLPFADFFTEKDVDGSLLPLDTEAIDITHNGAGSFALQGAWMMKEGSSVRLALAFDSSTMVDGDSFTLEAGSVLYYNGLMYTLTEDYTIDYEVVNSVEDYGVFLGYLHNSDVEKIENWDEWEDGTRVRIRVYFKEDVFINDDFTIVYDGALPAGYTYPVYTKCNDSGKETPITQGFYFWNDGEHTILELDGYAYHHNDELHGAPGTKLVQNGGYFIFEDEMYAYYNGAAWVVGAEKGTFGADAFDVRGSYYTTTVDGKVVKEIRFTTNGNTNLTAGGTTNRWFDAVVQPTVENMSNTEPYGVYFTDVNGNKSEVDNFIYHGQTTNNGYEHIFAFEDFEGTQAGETITIIAGTRIWVGANYYTATEDIVFYYNGTAWLVGNGKADATITVNNFDGYNFNLLEVGVNKVRMRFTSEMFGGQFGSLYIESGSVKVNGTAYTNLYYHGGGNKLFEIIGGTEHAIGQNAFEDTLIIKKGTKLWIGMELGSVNTPSCIEFGETLEWRYVGDGMKDGGGNTLQHNWVITNNTDITRANLVRVWNENDAGGQVRLQFTAGITKDSFQGFVAMDTSKGVPVVNGVEMPNKAFCFAGAVANLFEIRGGERGLESGDYIRIPKGSVWWTTQGSFTFTEEIYAVCSSPEVWSYGYNTEEALDGTVDMGNISAVKNDGANEIRLSIPRGISDTYYGPFALDGVATLSKANGTTIETSYGYWYGGNSASYTNDYISLVGLRANGFAGASNGDTLTIKAGSKFIIGNNGYHKVPNDIVYTYVDSTWKEGDLNGTATYSANKATVTGESRVIVGKTYSFTVRPDSGYVVSAVKVNDESVTVTANNEYTFTAEKTNNIVVETISTASAYEVSFVVGAGVTLDDGLIINGSKIYVVSGDSLTFKLEVEDGYKLVDVDGATDNGDGTYTLTPADNTTVTITTMKQWTVSYTISNATAIIYGQTVTSSSSITVDEGSYIVPIAANSGYAITSVTNATNNLDGTYTINVNNNINVVVTTKQSIKLGVSSINSIGVYDETNVDPTCMGVRFTMNANDFTKITAIEYGWTWNGSVTATVTGGVYHSSVFNNPHNFFELRFDTTNLKAGDSFTIAKGTVFSGAGANAYAIEWTEDIVGVWTGVEWKLLATKLGEIDWSTLTAVNSYSDYKDDVALNHMIRMEFNAKLFDCGNDTTSWLVGVTLNGATYTKRMVCHGALNLWQFNEWNYKKNDVLVIPAGSYIGVGTSYYLVTKTLTATCSADGAGAQWTVKIS